MNILPKQGERMMQAMNERNSAQQPMSYLDMLDFTRVNI